VNFPNSTRSRQWDRISATSSGFVRGLLMPPGMPQTAWVAFPPRMAWIRCALAREAITCPPTSSPTFEITPRTWRVVGSAWGPTTKSGAARA